MAALTMLTMVLLLYFQAREWSVFHLGERRPPSNGSPNNANNGTIVVFSGKRVVSISPGRGEATQQWQPYMKGSLFCLPINAKGKIEQIAIDSDLLTLLIELHSRMEINS